MIGIGQTAVVTNRGEEVVAILVRFGLDRLENRVKNGIGCGNSETFLLPRFSRNVGFVGFGRFYSLLFYYCIRPRSHALMIFFWPTRANDLFTCYCDFFWNNFHLILFLS